MRAPESEGASIVMVGAFNPAIFQPQWLGAQGLIRPEEASAAKITTIQPGIADFTTEWFQLQVLQARFQIMSEDPRQYSPLRDLAAAIITLLQHTPVTALGLNRHFHFEMRSKDAWHALGHELAPKAIWNTIVEEPGLRSMVMQGHRKGSNGGTVHIRVEPSPKVQPGVFVEVNEEFRATSEGTDEGAQWTMGCLAEQWDAVMTYSEEVAGHLMSLARD